MKNWEHCRSRRLWRTWRSAIRCIRTQFMPGRNSCMSMLGGPFDPKVGQEVKAQTEREIERLHAKVGQLMIENDFFAKRFGR